MMAGDRPILLGIHAANSGTRVDLHGVSSTANGTARSE